MTRWLIGPALVITVVLARWVVYRCLYRKHRATLTTPPQPTRRGSGEHFGDTLNRLELTFPGDMSYETPRLRALADVAFYFPGKPAGTAATDQLLDYLNEL